MDTNKGDMYDRASQLIFSEDSQVFAFHGYMDTSPDDDEYDDNASYDNYFVVINGEPQRSYDNTMGLAISKRSKKIAYVASRDSHTCFVVVNDKEMNSYPAIDHFSLQFSPDENHLGYLTFSDSIFEDRKASIIVIDTHESELFDDVYSKIMFTEDSKKAEYVAMQGNCLYWVEHLW